MFTHHAPFKDTPEMSYIKCVLSNITKHISTLHTITVRVKVILYGYNPIHNFLGASLNGQNGTDFRVDTYRIVLLAKSQGQQLLIVKGQATKKI